MTLYFSEATLEAFMELVLSITPYRNLFGASKLFWYFTNRFSYWDISTDNLPNLVKSSTSFSLVI